MVAGAVMRSGVGAGEGAELVGSAPPARDGASPLPIDRFLAVVGERVRRQRALVHMSRRELARSSAISERYLAQLETGRGNMSIALLRRVAVALELPLAELVAEEDAGIVVGRSDARLDR